MVLPVHFQLVEYFGGQLSPGGHGGQHRGHRGGGDREMSRFLSLTARCGILPLRGPGPPPLVTVHSNLRQEYKQHTLSLLLYLQQFQQNISHVQPGPFKTTGSTNDVLPEV